MQSCGEWQLLPKGQGAQTATPPHLIWRHADNMRRRLRHHLTFSVLLGTKLIARMFYRFRIAWIGRRPRDPWKNVKLVLFLNHTSLYEPLFAGWVPNRFLKTIARNGLLPVADKTFCRPLVGRFFKLVAGNVVPVSRERDSSWHKFVATVRSGSLVVIAPEGRMKRANGLDRTGKPMTVRGGVADLLLRISAGRMLIAYSGGLHHVQVPGQKLPRLFKTLKMNVESLDIGGYSLMLAKACQGDFKQAVIRDLERRRRCYCPAAVPLLSAPATLLS
jgi:1-acyl-sn-glycerol-3-phosphate acyltransferase